MIEVRESKNLLGISIFPSTEMRATFGIGNRVRQGVQTVDASVWTSVSTSKYGEVLASRAETPVN